MNPAGYYRIDLEAIRALPRAQALALLDEIRLDVTRTVGAQRARLVADEVDAQAAAHGEHGAQRRAAAALDMKKANIGRLYTDHKERTMTTSNSNAARISEFVTRSLNESSAPDAAETHDVEAITEEIGTTYGYDVDPDTIDPDEYWGIVATHNTDGGE